MYLTSAALLVIDRASNIYNYVPYVDEALFGLSFHRLRVLRISGGYRRPPTLDVLHCFQCLEELSLTYVSALPHHKPLPLARTLKRLSIYRGCVKWLGGHNFVQLLSFSVKAYPGIPFPRVEVPVCTSIRFYADNLDPLPKLQANIVAPLLYEWNLNSPVLSRKYFQLAKNGIKQAGIEALQQIRVRKLLVSIDD